MVRVQLYLDDGVYKTLKSRAKEKGMTFAGFVRLHLENEVLDDEKGDKTALQKFPFLKYAGKFNWGPSSSNNEEIDKAIYDL